MVLLTWTLLTTSIRLISMGGGVDWKSYWSGKKRMGGEVVEKEKLPQVTL